MPHRKTDLIGQHFGKLTVVEFVKRDKHSNSFWKCKCDCGNFTVATKQNLRRGHTSSCGCLKSIPYHKTHGYAGSSTYISWLNIRSRCEDINNVNYCRYGGRGIVFCERWRLFENFLNDMGEKPEGMTVERIDNNGNYEPSNCRWATPKEQARNTRNNVLVSHNGITLCIAEWAEQLCIPYGRLQSRLKHGWSIERAFNE